MPSDEPVEEAQIIAAAFEERVKELFRSLAESIYTGEAERATADRFRRGLQSARKARALALAAAKES